MNRIIFVLFLSALNFLACYGAASVTNEEAVPAKKLLSQKEFFETFHPYPSEIEFNNAVARFKRDIKKINWEKDNESVLSFLTHLCTSYDTFFQKRLTLAGTPLQGCAIPRASFIPIYQTECLPYIDFMEASYFKPLVKALEQNETVNPGAPFGLLPGREKEGSIFYLGFVRNEEHTYCVVIPWNRRNRFLECNCYFATPSLREQLTFVVNGPTLITEPGILVDKGGKVAAGEFDLRLRKYYGNLKAGTISLYSEKEVSPICEPLLKELGAERVLFVSFPRTREDHAMLNLLLLKDLAREKDPETQRANLRLLETYGFFEEPSQDRTPLALPYILGEEVPSTPAAGALPQASHIPAKPYEEIMADLEKKISDPLEAQFREEIQREQEAIRARVARDSQQVPEPRKQKKKGARPPQATAAPAAAAEAPDDNIESRVKDLMKNFQLKGLEKFRHLRPVLSTFFKHRAAEERTKGSHHTIGSLNGRSITIAHHGPNDIVPTAAILRDLIRSFGE